MKAVGRLEPATFRFASECVNHCTTVASGGGGGGSELMDGWGVPFWLLNWYPKI